jgi:hypothetical protein
VTHPQTAAGPIGPDATPGWNLLTRRRTRENLFDRVLTFSDVDVTGCHGLSGTGELIAARAVTGGLPAACSSSISRAISAASSPLLLGVRASEDTTHLPFLKGRQRKVAGKFPARAGNHPMTA